MNIQMNEVHTINICDQKRQVATKSQTYIMFLLLKFISPNYNLSIIRIHRLIIKGLFKTYLVTVYLCYLLL
jgi:hypothetical protein